ncbi:MAG TPA: substrate-binding domain-containing protein, partial [Acidimicrobiales bacterium]|nr:substrate-binding domain-containing protein [Acidimicrobiales bacterium]
AVALVAAGLSTAMVALTAGAASVTATLSGDLTYSGTTYAGVNSAFGGSTFDEPFLDASIPVYLTQASNKSGASAVPTGLPLYDGVGSSAGKKGVENGTFQVGFTDVPLGTVTGINHNVNLDTLAGTSPATTLSSYIQVPIVLGGVAVAYNFPHSVTKAWPKGQSLILNATTIAKIYTGGITKWNDPAIKALNPKLVKTTIKKNKAGKVISRHTTSLLPNLAITPVYRADGSGTSFAFESYLNQAAPSVFAGNAAITATTAWPGTSWPSGLVGSDAIGAQKSAGVAYDVSQTSGGIGYMESAYVSQNGLGEAKIVNKAGHAEADDAATVSADALSFTLPSENANGVVSNFDIANGTAANAYPISTYSWAVVPSDFKQIALSSDTGGSTGGLTGETVVAKFLDWAVQDKGGQELATKEGYVPLPGPVSLLGEQQIATLTFGGATLALS